ncbi:hypothetical protein BLNAU_3135 [Blattamonas nauphoetae]|uniref:Uncharacterized protein n=1 Tax=Blattamonas nauphoetae TaxID=2049346 RepID=A0ABQ9YD51_9EUKA|nr:hypothetical protein BLNAU_3135 [Blattamonas nauphoetae]
MPHKLNRSIPYRLPIPYRVHPCHKVFHKDIVCCLMIQRKTGLELDRTMEDAPSGFVEYDVNIVIVAVMWAPSSSVNLDRLCMLYLWIVSKMVKLDRFAENDEVGVVRRESGMESDSDLRMPLYMLS